MRHSLLWACMLIVLISACAKSVVYGDLNQRDANEILVLLTGHGIRTGLERELRQNQTYYAVVVDPDDLDRARALMDENNLPRKKKPGLADIFGEPGFIPTPEEQKARFLLALKGEIVNSLERIPDVVEADVIVNIPSREGLDAAEKPQRPTASVVLKVRPTDQAVATLTEAKIQRFVANAVENLDPRDVAAVITYTGPPSSGLMPGQSLILSDAAGLGGTGGAQKTRGGGANGATDGATVSIAGLAVGPESAGKLRLYLGLFLGLLALLSIGLVAMVVQASRMRQEMRGMPGMPGMPGMQEGPALEGGEGQGTPPQLQSGGEGV